MKNILLLYFLLALPCWLGAQSSDFKFGRVSDPELQMTAYEKDPSAPAVVLYEDNQIYYTVNLDTYEIKRILEYTVRIKILTADGTSYGDVEIPYYDAPSVKELVTGVSANSYHLENGKTVKTSLKRQGIFNERYSEHWHHVKFAIPEVKPGSVIEYKYKVISDRLGTIPDINVQRSIPVAYSKMESRIPEYFKFNYQTKGYVYLNLNRKTESQSQTGAGGGLLMYNEDIVSFEISDVPALKKEPLVWDIDDFRTKLVFELAAYDVPGSMYKPFAQTWASVNKLLEEHPDFARGLRLSNPFKEEVAAIVAANPESQDRIRAIHRLVLSRISWNEYYSLLPDSKRQIVREGNGSSADINFVLMSALKAAGFSPVPILLNPRQYGRLPLTLPSIDMINTFVVGIPLPDGMVVVDGTSKYSDINVLPSELLVDRTRIYGINDEKAWVDLTQLARNMTQANMIATVGEDGTLSGEIIRNYINQPTLRVKERYAKAGEEDYLETLEENDGLTIEKYEIAGLDTLRVTEQYAFKKSLNTSGDRIYLHATGLPFMSKNILTAQERVLPVEYDYPESYVVNSSFIIPEGYTVEEMPEGKSLTACNGALRMTFIGQQVGNQVSVRMTFQMSRIIFPATEYPELKTFFDMVVSQSGSQIVLRKM